MHNLQQKGIKGGVACAAQCLSRGVVGVHISVSQVSVWKMPLEQKPLVH